MYGAELHAKTVIFKKKITENTVHLIYNVIRDGSSFKRSENVTLSKSLCNEKRKRGTIKIQKQLNVGKQNASPENLETEKNRFEILKGHVRIPHMIGTGWEMLVLKNFR